MDNTSTQPPPLKDLIKLISTGNPVIYTGYDEIEYQAVPLVLIKQGEDFKRSLMGHHILIRNHYNRKDCFGPANFSCTYADDMNREVFLKPTTIVWKEI